MKRKHAIFVAILMLASPLFTLAQSQGEDDKGRVWGDYTVHQSIELGGHIADAEGNQQTYGTFVNLYSGPRILGADLSMQSISHQGLLFDNLYVSSFGFGGDPESVARLRMQKNKWYNFVALYRRDKNYFDYNLFANPMNLNPGIATCGVGCTNAITPSALPWYTDSPHLQTTARNMGDFTLTLLPESAISFRLGYARNATYGTVDTSLEAPIRTILTEDSQWRSDRYQFGVDLKMLPRTTISLDAFFEHDKNDIGFLDGNVLYALGNTGGPQVDIGVLLPPLGGTLPSCFNGQTIQPNNVFIINAGCTGVLLNTGPGGPYFRRGNVRTDIPSGQFSLQSNYFRNLDITASGTYSSATSDYLNFNEFMHGSTATLNSGIPSTDRVSANVDLGVTYHFGKNWSISDKFRWLNWREPGAFTNTAFNCVLPAGALGAPAGFPAGAVTLTPLRNPCVSDILTLTGLTTAGNAASGNYEQVTAYSSLVGERSYFNTFKVNWQPSRHFSGYIGYRYAGRELRDGNAAVGGILSQVTTTFANDGSGAVPPISSVVTNSGTVDGERINQHTALMGVVVRPVDAWRINGDVELQDADNSFVLLNPRHQQRARVYSTFKVNRRVSINGGLHFVESRNAFAQSDTVAGTNNPLFPTGVVPVYGHKDHWRYYTLGTTMNPNSKLTFDFGWTYLDQDIKAATCMPVPANAFPGLTPPSVCANGNTARALVLAYQETTNSAYTNISYQPVKRLTLSAGYEFTGDNGKTDWLRIDTGMPLLVVGDIYGNSPPLAGNPITPCPGAAVAAGCVFPGPFPDQPLGPQAINWHKAHLGVAIDVAKGVQFKGLWDYYDYNSKDHPDSLVLLRVTTLRDFHANVGTVSLKYSF
ncbi:MAG: hypothetical protein LAN37_04070 [Acidobacteriia bacterium]|nr:hypothetical protein [Terriglobia bacterium]